MRLDSPFAISLEVWNPYVERVPIFRLKGHGRSSALNMGSLNYPFWVHQQCKCMVILKDFPYDSTLVWVGNVMTPLLNRKTGQFGLQ